jgi:putative oxidoreductase
MFKNRSATGNTQLLEDVYSSGLKPSGDPLMPARIPVVSPAVPAHLETWQHDEPEQPRSAIERAAHIAGRAVFGGYFVYSGIGHFLNRKQLSGYAESKDVPAADAAVVGTGLMMIAGGLSIVAGVRPKLGAGAIAGFLLGVSPIMHAFWNEQEPAKRMNEMVNFGKNMALVGGALLAAGQPEA